MFEFDWERIREIEKTVAPIFENMYKRKYSLAGAGIFNLVLFGDKIYEFKVKKVGSLPKEDGKYSTDKTKNGLIEKAEKVLKEKYKAVLNSGKLYLTIDGLIVGIEFIKKQKMPT